MQSRQIIRIGAFGERENVGRFAVRKVEQTCWILGDFGDDEVSQVGEKISRDVGQVVTLLREVVDDAQARVGISIDERCSERVQHGSIGDAENASDTFGSEFVSVDADPSEHLIEEAHAVAHTSGSFASDDGQSGVFEGDAFLF